MSEVFEHTLVLIKPDGVRRGLVGETIRRVETVGLKLVASKMLHPSKEMIMKHLPCTDEWRTNIGKKTLENFEKYNKNPIQEIGTDNPMEIGMEVQNWLVEYLTSGPVVVMAFYGVHAIDMVRKIIGHTIPNKAEMGTIRGDYSVDSPTLANLQKRAIMNVVHASGDKIEAANEIALWFSPDEIFEYRRDTDFEL